ncbi:Solute carrier family 22 member 6 [Chionoecetes opilio]|uniref:Solute carrier family 22 member 6 n=1 Tax=Chionoecetes opilio TaxID=41210 RepID=A0A8J5CYZ9_CHIOP|nr:Solute carrier family 22 member 6 [Chionoecetes opilio]
MVGKMAISINFQMIIFFSSELFPTEVRGRGVSTAFMMSRLGSMGAPFITDLVGSMYPWAPSSLRVGCLVLSGRAPSCCLETQAKFLPDHSGPYWRRERTVGTVPPRDRDKNCSRRSPRLYTRRIQCRTVKGDQPSHVASIHGESCVYKV